MYSNQEITARLQAKLIVESEIKKRQPQVQKVIKIFGNENPKDLFESKLTIELGKKDVLHGPVDFVYHKLNLQYLNWLGMDLEYAKYYLAESEKNDEIEYAEYYSDSTHSCIIFVRYKFKQVELPCGSGMENFKTHVFVNSKCEIFYYDDYSGIRFLKSFYTNLTAQKASKLFTQKKYKVSPAPGRTYQISKNNSNDSFEEETFDNIHMIYSRLLDILLEKYSEVPYQSKLKVESRFLGVTENPISVCTNVTVNYSYTGTIEVTEKLEQYEITLYFSDFPEQKVRARLALISAEKKQSIRFTKNHLTNALLTSPENSTFSVKKREISECMFLFHELFVAKCEQHVFEEKSALLEIGDIISKHITLEGTTLKVPEFKDTFEKIYIEYFKVHANELPKEYSIKLLKSSSFTASSSGIFQNEFYSIIYNGTFYLVKIHQSYYSYNYDSPSLKIYIPNFNAHRNSIHVFKPTSKEEVDAFLNETLDNSYDWKISIYYNHDLYTKHTHNMRNIFPNFAIESSPKKEILEYTISHKYSDEILSNLLKYVQKEGTHTTAFNFRTPIIWGGDDDDCKIVTFPISSNGIVYGINRLEESYSKCVNSPFNEFKPEEYSTANDLIKIEFQSTAPSFKTTFHDLLNSFGRDCRINTVEGYKLEKSEFWKFCISFLIKNQNEIFS